jgi:hypothetical protein
MSARWINVRTASVPLLRTVVTTVVDPIVTLTGLEPATHLFAHLGSGVHMLVSDGTFLAGCVDAGVVKTVLCDQSLTLPPVGDVPMVPTRGIVDERNAR